MHIVLHRGSELSLLVFANAVETTTERSRKSLIGEMLYADDLILSREGVEDIRKKFG